MTIPAYDEIRHYLFDWAPAFRHVDTLCRRESSRKQAA